MKETITGYRPITWSHENMLYSIICTYYIICTIVHNKYTAQPTCIAGGVRNCVYSIFCRKELLHYLFCRATMQLHVRGLETHVIDCEGHETIANIKSRVATLEGAEPSLLSLTCEGAPLDDDLVINSLSCLNLEANIGLPGGKVHGSLARAGKVKGQTPRVEKAEKKKKKTGRAKRRIQYNRRFVNIVQAFGRRRGPNANS
ncbi:hypothetical protein B566_EDAN010894 [Ephemera danica]|nr:hypothetical protein B566_EDAN010894 [Ephemera danica]